MDAHEWFGELAHLTVSPNALKLLALLLFQNWKWLEYSVMQRVEEFR